MPPPSAASAEQEGSGAEAVDDAGGSGQAAIAAESSLPHGAVVAETQAESEQEPQCPEGLNAMQRLAWQRKQRLNKAPAGNGADAAQGGCRARLRHTPPQHSTHEMGAKGGFSSTFNSTTKSHGRRLSLGLSSKSNESD